MQRQAGLGQAKLRVLPCCGWSPTQGKQQPHILSWQEVGCISWQRVIGGALFKSISAHCAFAICRFEHVNGLHSRSELFLCNCTAQLDACVQGSMNQ